MCTPSRPWTASASAAPEGCPRPAFFYDLAGVRKLQQAGAQAGAPLGAAPSDGGPSGAAAAEGSRAGMPTTLGPNPTSNASSTAIPSSPGNPVDAASGTAVKVGTQRRQQQPVDLAHSCRFAAACLHQRPSQGFSRQACRLGPFAGVCGVDAPRLLASLAAAALVRGHCKRSNGARAPQATSWHSTGTGACPLAAALPCAQQGAVPSAPACNLQIHGPRGENWVLTNAHAVDYATNVGPLDLQCEWHASRDCKGDYGRPLCT